MNALIARCARLSPTLATFRYAIPLRLMVGHGFMEHGYAKLASERGTRQDIHR